MKKDANKHLLEGKYGISDLVDVERLHNIFEKFSAATGFTIGFVEQPSQKILISAGWRDICTKFHRSCPASAKNCLKSNIKLAKKLKTQGQIAVEECGNGLVDCATPIVIGGKYLAMLATGQVLTKKPDIESFRRQAKRCGYNTREYLKALQEVRVTSKEELKDVMSFLGEIASLITEMGLRNLEIKEKTIGLESEIAKRKKVEQTLRDSEEKFRSLAEKSPNMIFINKEGRIVYANNKCEEIMGYSKAELYSPKFDYRRLVAPEYIERTERDFRRHMHGGEVEPFEYEVMTKKGGRIKAIIATKLVEYGKGKAILGVITDITERKKTEQKLRESEERYRQLVELSPDGIAVHKNGRIVFANTVGARTLGFRRPEELIGKKVIEVVHPSSYKTVKERVRKMMRFQKVPTVEEKFLTKDGKTIDVEVSASALMYQGEPAIQVIVRDITERKRIADELKRVKDHLQTILDGIEESIVVIDRKYRIVNHNKAFIKSLRDRKDGVINEPCFKAIHGFPKPCRKCVVRDALRKGKPAYDIHYHLDREGKTYHEVKAYPIKDALNRASQCIYVFRDVTDRERMYETIKEANVRLEELGKMKTDFVSIASHELRTPLAIIKGYVEVLRSNFLGELNEKQKMKLDAISTKIKQLNELIENILDISVMDSGEFKINRVKTDLNALAGEVVEDFGEISGGGNIDIRLKTNKTPVEAFVDPERMKQVLTNIVDNSVKFTPKTGIIRIIVSKEHDKAVVRVEDTGIGIPKSSVNKVFNRFYQQDSSRRRRYKGVGLGLSICKRIVELHGGRIYIRSWVNKGTVVTIKLPM